MAIDLKTLDTRIEALDARKRKLQKLRELLGDEETMEVMSDPEIMNLIQASAGKNGHHSVAPTATWENLLTEEENLPAEGTLRRTVLDVARKCPTTFHGKYIFEQLKLANYEFGADKPEVSIHGTLIFLAKKKLIRVVRKGSGRQPNIYEAIKKASE